MERRTVMVRGLVYLMRARQAERMFDRTLGVARAQADQGTPTDELQRRANAWLSGMRAKALWKRMYYYWPGWLGDDRMCSMAVHHIQHLDVSMEYLDRPYYCPSCSELHPQGLFGRRMHEALNEGMQSLDLLPRHLNLSASAFDADDVVPADVKARARAMNTQVRVVHASSLADARSQIAAILDEIAAQSLDPMAEEAVKTND
jgi:hypothetical protein